MQELKKAADEVLGQLQADKLTMAFDPATIMIIIEALKILLPLVLEWCDEEPEAVPELAEGVLKPDTVKEYTRRWWARRTLSKELGRKQYNQAGGEALLDAVCRKAVSTDPQRIAVLYSELSD